VSKGCTPILISEVAAAKLKLVLDIPVARVTSCSKQNILTQVQQKTANLISSISSKHKVSVK